MKVIKEGCKTTCSNTPYKDGNYKVSILDNKIHIKRKKGRLEIAFSDCLKEDETNDIVKNMFNYVVTLLAKRDLVLKISGTNEIILSKDLLSLQGCVILENVKLHNPILYNVELLNVDLSKSREVAIGFSTIRNCTTDDGMALKVMYTNLPNQHHFDKFIKKLKLSGN